MSRYTSCRPDKRKHPVLVRHQRIGTNQNSFDPTEHSRVCPDAKCEANQRKEGKTRTTSKHSEPKTKILEKSLHLVRHSVRSASIGFTNVARRAGIHEARSVAAKRRSATPK